MQIGALRLIRCPVYVAKGRLKASLPARPVFGADGQQLLDPAGRNLYQPEVEWATQAAATQFSDGIVAAIEAQYREVGQ